MRIGTNHGCLSDRIMNRYGDTPLGMVESALEFARIARELDYHDFIFSMKSSNPKVMIEAYRLLVARLAQEGPDWNYPIHLGVTEAGDGEDGRIKSAIGIGSLLNDGIGDTIRVSLTEDSVHEIPVAAALAKNVARNTSSAPVEKSQGIAPGCDPFTYKRRESHTIEREGVKLGGEELVRVLIRRENFDKIAHKIDKMGDYKPEIVYEDAQVKEIDPRDDAAISLLNESRDDHFVTVKDSVGLPVIAAYRLLAAKLAARHPILLKDTLAPSNDPNADFLVTLLTAATNIGSLLCDGIGDAILVQGEHAPRPGAPAGLQHPASRGFAHLQDRLRRLPMLRTHAFQPANHHRENQGSHPAPQGRENRHHGLHRERPRRNGRRRFRLRGRRARQGESLRRQDPCEIQHPRSGSRRPSQGLDPRARQMGRA